MLRLGPVCRESPPSTQSNRVRPASPSGQSSGAAWHVEPVQRSVDPGHPSPRSVRTAVGSLLRLRAPRCPSAPVLHRCLRAGPSPHWHRRCVGPGPPPAPPRCVAYSCVRAWFTTSAAAPPAPAPPVPRRPAFRRRRPAANPGPQPASSACILVVRSAGCRPRCDDFHQGM